MVVVSGGSYFQPLSWNLRLKVALGAAKGVAFLHSAETKVIYRDFKTSNILLDTVCKFSSRSSQQLFLFDRSRVCSLFHWLSNFRFLINYHTELQCKAF